MNRSTRGSSEPNDSLPFFQLARITGRTSRIRLGLTPSPVFDQGAATA